MAAQKTPPRTPKAPGGTAEAVREAIAGPVAAAGLDLEDVSLRRAGSRVLLQVLVDTDGGVTLDAVAALSSGLAETLDASGVMGDRAYVLDVGSPGVDRGLTLTRHWRRNSGRLVRLTGTDASEQTGRIISVIGPADDAAPSAVSLEVGGAAVELSAAFVRRAVVQVEFNVAQPLED